MLKQLVFGKQFVVVPGDIAFVVRSEMTWEPLAWLILNVTAASPSSASVTFSLAISNAGPALCGTLIVTLETVAPTDPAFRIVPTMRRKSIVCVRGMVSSDANALRPENGDRLSGGER